MKTCPAKRFVPSLMGLACLISTGQVYAAPVEALKLAQAGDAGAPGSRASSPAVAAAKSLPAARTPESMARPVLVDLDAQIRVESQVLGADGVLRSSVYEERMMRRGSEVWTRRVIPAAAPQVRHDPGHKHFNPLEGGRVVSQEAGKTGLRFVLDEDRTIVSVPPPEFGNVGFDGSWERAYFMVTAGELSRLKPSGRKSTVAGAVWYEKENGGQYERVLWDPALSVVRVMESGAGKGAKTFKVVVTPSTRVERQAGWRQPEGYEQKRYSDFLD